MPRFDEDTGLEWRTVTYGVMPDKDEWLRRWAVVMGDKRYPIGNLHGWSGDYSGEELFARMSHEVEVWNGLTDETAAGYDEEDGISVVADILSAHFAWEWV